MLLRQLQTMKTLNNKQIPIFSYSLHRSHLDRNSERNRAEAVIWRFHIELITSLTFVSPRGVLGADARVERPSCALELNQEVGRPSVRLGGSIYKRNNTNNIIQLLRRGQE